MAHGDIDTIDKDGLWTNRVEGDPERSASYASRDEAVEAGRALAAQLGSVHHIHDAAPTGDITDEQI